MTWYNESVRHGLSRRGIKTSKYYAARQTLPGTIPIRSPASLIGKKTRTVRGTSIPRANISNAELAKIQKDQAAIFEDEKLTDARRKILTLPQRRNKLEEFSYTRSDPERQKIIKAKPVMPMETIKGIPVIGLDEEKLVDVISTAKTGKSDESLRKQRDEVQSKINLELARGADGSPGMESLKDSQRIADLKQKRKLIDAELSQRKGVESSLSKKRAFESEVDLTISELGKEIEERVRNIDRLKTLKAKVNRNLKTKDDVANAKAWTDNYNKQMKSDLADINKLAAQRKKLKSMFRAPTIDIVSSEGDEALEVNPKIEVTDMKIGGTIPKRDFVLSTARVPKDTLKDKHGSVAAKTSADVFLYGEAVKRRQQVKRK